MIPINGGLEVALLFLLATAFVLMLCWIFLPFWLASRLKKIDEGLQAGRREANLRLGEIALTATDLKSLIETMKMLMERQIEMRRAAAEATAPTFHYADDSGAARGPFTPAQMRAFARAGTIFPHTQVLREGDETWAAYEDFDELILEA